MNQKDLEKILSSVDVTGFDWIGPRQVMISCPLAKWFHKSKSDNNPSCGIKLGDEKTWTKFHCFSCHESGNLWQLVESIGHLKKDVKLLELSQWLIDYDQPRLSQVFASLGDKSKDWFYSSPDDTAISHKILERFPKVDMGSRFGVYLNERGISHYSTQMFDLREDEYQDRIFFPVWNLRNHYCTYRRCYVPDILVGAVGRLVYDGNPKYYNYFNVETAKTFGGIDRLEGHPKILLVEGFFDLLNCYEWAQSIQMDVLCTFKSEVSKEQLEILSGFNKTIYCGFDSDVAGEKGWNKLKRYKNVLGEMRRFRVEEDDFGSINEKEFRYMFRK